MNYQQQDTVSFTVLFTAQKLKKNKTWQDGTITYHNFNRKIVLIDEKGYKIDRMFSKTGVPSVGDEIEFDMHIVTVESSDLSSQQDQQQHQQVESETSLSSRQRYHAYDRILDHDYRLARRQLKQAAISVRKQPENLQALPLQRPTASQSLEQTSTSPLMKIDRAISSFVPPRPVHLTTSKSTEDTETLATPLSLGIAAENERSESEADPSHLRASSHPTKATVAEHSSIPMTSDNSCDALPVQLSVTPRPSTSIVSAASTPTFALSSFSPNAVLDDVPANSESRLRESDSIKRAPPVENNVSSTKRIRVGLSRRTNQHASTNLTTTTTMPSIQPCRQNQSPRRSAACSDDAPQINTRSSFMPASTVTIEDVDAPTPSMPSSSSSSSLSTATSSKPSKQFRVPYAEGVTVPLVLQFPTMEKAMSVIKSKRLPRRNKVVPPHFSNIAQYKDIFKRMIHEHLQIMLLNNALHFYAHLPSAKADNLERHFRSKGLGFYQGCILKSISRSIAGSSFSLTVRNRENSYKYSKDDIWVVSKVVSFDSSSTFLARSTFYGPSSSGNIEIECITPRDTRVATNMALEHTTIFALRTISAGTEFMMLDALDDALDRLPLLPNILKPAKQKKRQEVMHMPTLVTIKLTSHDSINVNQKLDETIRLYNLNRDQESALRAVAKSVILSPEWDENADNPITLVHGVFGSGKSFLAAVIIIFLRDIIDTANRHREPEDQICFRIIISCFTNIAVDRILTTLVKLGYDEFVRVGSLKKIAKNLLPYTVKAKLSGNEELKELEQMLEDPQNSEEDADSIAGAIQRFRRCENMLEVQRANVVGTTCSASCFEIFSESDFPFILMDECSQVMEPLTMVPLSRFKCSRMVMIGDPKQLPPTIATQPDEHCDGLGLDKSLFSRLIEMGTQSILLRTQYRCHPQISAISNNLFYDRQLLNGPSVVTRPPLIEGLPPVLFVDVIGNEQRSIGNSYWNQDEVAVAAHTIQGLNQLGIAPEDIGIISLYKEQSDKIQAYLGSSSKKSIQNIQISTVDAFQGAEKEIIILSTVRTSSSGFIDKHPRVNVALTRAKRHLIILGNRNLLSNNEVWSKVIQDCQGNTMSMNSFASLISSLQTLESEILS